MNARGKFVLTVLILGVLALGAWKWWPKLTSHAAGTPATSPPSASDALRTRSEPSAATAQAPELVETQTAVPKLGPAAAYQPKDKTIEIELSEYAGYAGLIVANGGLAPNENSVFFKKHGFKVAIKLSEE